MVPKQRLLLIVAADRRELAGFRNLKPVDIGLHCAFRADLADGPALLVAHGPGRENARGAVQAAAERFDLSAVVSTGYAGGLDQALAVGDIVVVERILELDSRVGYPVKLSQAASAPAKSGVLVTIDMVAQTVAEKVRLRAAGADLVDMEAAEVARQAQALGLPFYCVRVISDAAGDDFSIDFNRARRADGTFSGWRVLWQVGLSPRRWKDLLKLKRNGELAAANLAAFLSGCLFNPPSK